MDSINEQVKHVERLWMLVPGEKGRRKWKKERGSKVKEVDVEERQLRLYRGAPCGKSHHRLTGTLDQTKSKLPLLQF